jgi:hypothetical protein
MRPINELQGVRMMSLNYINAEDAQKYQVGQQNNGTDTDSNGNTNEEQEDEE